MLATLGRKEARGPSLAQNPAWPRASRWPPWDSLPPLGKGPDQAGFQHRAQQSSVFCETLGGGLKETESNQRAQTSRPPGLPTVGCRRLATQLS